MRVEGTLDPQLTGTFPLDPEDPAAFSESELPSRRNASFEEKESWINAITSLFPEHSFERAENFFSQAHGTLSSQNPKDRNIYIQLTLERIKALFSNEQVKSLGPMIADIVEADGIVMTSEMEIVSLSEKILDISIEVE